MKKYKIDRWNIKIKCVEIERETAKQVFLLGGRREAKNSGYADYFSTFDEAKACMAERNKNAINSTEISLTSLKEDRQKISELVDI